MSLKKNLLYLTLPICLFSVSNSFSQANMKTLGNPLLAGSNVPVSYAKVTSKHVEEYAKNTIAEVTTMIASIKKQKAATFDMSLVPWIISKTKWVRQATTALC
jgi:hypothetical protein